MAGHFVNEGDPPMISHEWRYFSLPKGADLRPPDLPTFLLLWNYHGQEFANYQILSLCV